MKNENIIIVEMENGTKVKVIKGNMNIRYYELKEQIEDLFYFKKSYKSKELIPLSKICDSMYDLLFYGIDKDTKEIYFRAC
jgi:hypothetical protein